MKQGMRNFILSRAGSNGRMTEEVWTGANLARYPALNGVARRWRILCRMSYAENVPAIQAGYRAYRMTPAGLAVADMIYLRGSDPDDLDDPDT